MQGTIVSYNQEKAYGFITTESRLARIFFHVTEWRHGAVPVIGQLVEFNLTPDAKSNREMAANVTIVEVREAGTAEQAERHPGGAL